MKSNGEVLTQSKCLSCKVPNTGFFCDLSMPAREAFDSIKTTTVLPKKARIFIEGQPAHGVYMLCQGRVKLSTHSQNGKALILRIAMPGEILGLSAAISGGPNETTAEVVEAAQVNFVRKDHFRRFLAQHADAGMNSLKQLSLQYRHAYGQIRSLGLSTCVGDRLANLFLEWSKETGATDDPVTLKNSFSHEEIAEMIGTTRETVTRLLKQFRERGLISTNGYGLRILSRRNLESVIGNGNGIFR